MPDADTNYIPSRLASGQFYEEALLLVIATRLERGALVLDVGANIGSHTCFLAAAGYSFANVARKHTDHFIVLPNHRKPAAREAVLPRLEGFENVVVTEPLGYAEFTKVMAASTIVVTDSGGVQEEAPSLGKPVLVMRENTERPEAIDAGTVGLVGTDRERIEFEVNHLITDPQAYAAMANAVNTYGDGKASA